MKSPIYLPLDEVVGTNPDLDRAADFLELSAFFSPEGETITSSLGNDVSISAEEKSTGPRVERTQNEEELVIGAVNRINERYCTLDASYPFRLDRDGDILRFLAVNDFSLGQAAYVLCLILSNLKSVSAVLIGSDVHPNDDEVRELRQYFQYFATAALAAEIQGKAWSFGFPRPDGSPFIDKLNEIWDDIRDGRIEAQPWAPKDPKDDKVDVFAARPHRDQLPGFLIAVAQVTTGKNPMEKSLIGHIRTFKDQWFATPPVTRFIPYMIVPFAIQRDQFIRNVSIMGNVLHRLRVPVRVVEAGDLMKAGTMIEGYDRLADALKWLKDYRNRFAV